MSYRKAAGILPAELLEKVQQYVDGACIYIPRKADGKKAWGAGNGARQELDRRDRRILDAYLAGEGIQELAEKYFLSIKSIQRILRQQKRQA